MHSGPRPRGRGPLLRRDRGPPLDCQQQSPPVRPEAPPPLRAQQLRGQRDGQAAHIIHRVGGQWQLLLPPFLRHAGLGDGPHCHRSDIYSRWSQLLGKVFV